MTRKIIYLASPYGFSIQWRQKLLPEFISVLEGLGCEVWEPFQRNSQINLASDSSVDLIASEIEAVLVKNKYVQQMIKDSFEEEN